MSMRLEIISVLDVYQFETTLLDEEIAMQSHIHIDILTCIICSVHNSQLSRYKHYC